MLPIISKPAISRRQKAMAISVAAIADTLQLVLFPALGEGFISPFEDALDTIVAIVLIAICGFKWQFILAFMLELVPAFDLLPTWTAVVLMLPVEEVGRINVAQTNIHQNTQYPPIDVGAVVVPPVKGSETTIKR